MRYETLAAKSQAISALQLPIGLDKKSLVFFLACHGSSTNMAVIQHDSHFPFVDHGKQTVACPIIDLVTSWVTS